MKNNPLSVAFLWHMHQPLYKDPMTGIYRLPWVRLHGTKDYLDMVELLKDFPRIRQNFNLVPSLLEQITDYTDRNATDIFLEIGRKPASALTQDEKFFILENFFLANWETMIKPFPRYYELLMKRGTHAVKTELPRIARLFTEADFRDLQVLFNLIWIDPFFRTNDPFLKMLSSKGRNFNEDEKTVFFEKQMEILKKIIPAYRDMARTGQVELSFSPFYHPILPLLCDSDIARIGMPGVKLPKNFRHPEDATEQISAGREYCEHVFGFRPDGMWPSEGSVSEEVLQIASGLGIRWIATDEGILSRSLQRTLRDGAGNMTEPGMLYRPYQFENVSIVFRDHVLSDLIGFVYSQWEPEKAADDLVERLLTIRNSLPGDAPRLVPIILDGENAWEYYRNDGRDFFLRLYDRLSTEERLQTVTISEFLTNYDRGEKLNSVFPGSWINSDFHVWIGHEEDNLAWEYLSLARDALSAYQKQNPATDTNAAWKSLYAAEGSDWNWWYGDEHTTETQEDFDELFRLNLMKVYREIGQEPPEELFLPVLRQDRKVAPQQAIKGFIQPRIDGVVTNYYEWYQGGRLDVKKSGGSMHKAEGIISKVYFGFDKENLFLRVDPEMPFGDFEEGIEFAIIIAKPFSFKVACSIKGEIKGMLYEKAGEGWSFIKEFAEVAVKDIFEISIPFAEIKAKEKDELNLFISVRNNGNELERCPWRGHITVIVPTPDFEAMMWS